MDVQAKTDEWTQEDDDAVKAGFEFYEMAADSVKQFYKVLNKNRKYYRSKKYRVTVLQALMHVVSNVREMASAFIDDEDSGDEE